MKPDGHCLPGLPELLREARLASGLSQAQVGAALGMERRYAKSFISRLEHGILLNPSLRLIIDFLRACKAEPDKTCEVFKRWLAVPLPVPERRQAPRTRARQRKEDLANLELRRQAAWYTLAQVLEHFLHHEFRATDLPAGERWRRASVRLARRVFRILYETREGDARNRKRRLNRAQAWAMKKTVPGELIEYLVDRVTGLFRDMEKDGDLAWLPSLEDAKETMAASPSKRVVTDEQMCRHEFVARKGKEHDEFEQRLQPIVEKVEALLASAGLKGNQAGSYRAFVTAFTNAARSTKPGSDERRRAVEMQMILVKKWHDPALVERIRDLVLSEWDRPA